MDPLSALIAFSIAAALLTMTPGLDTALVLRTAVVEGPKQALHAGAGVVTGVLAWGLIAALGLGAVLAVSETAYFLLQIAGAAYLLYLGVMMLRGALLPRKQQQAGVPAVANDHRIPAREGRGSRWFYRGMLTNLLNPKVGVFYISFLPQFIPAGTNVVMFSVILAAIHAAMGILWFAALTAATRSLGTALQRPLFSRALDTLTGGVFIAFAVKLALDRR